MEHQLSDDNSENYGDRIGDPSPKIISIAAGEAHTLALTGDGQVFSWGRGMFGRLGTGSEADQLLPGRVKFDLAKEKGLKFVGIAAGAYHSLALADDGSIWCWGYNVYGQLGFDGENSLVPCLMEGFNELGFPGQTSDNKASLKVCSIKAGGMMSLATDDLGGLWIWGNCPQKGSVSENGFSLLSSYTPIPVWDFHGHTVVKVACGNEHVIALVSAGEVYKGDDLICYSWGNNSHGQLGVGDREGRVHPQIIETFNHDSSWAVYEVACGAFHTALLTQKKSPSDTLVSTCWTFGLGDNGQLGHGTTLPALVPKPVEQLPQNIYLSSVDCGLFHTSVVSSAGEVWSWGMEKGLGLCPDASFTGTDAGDAIFPLLIPCTGVHGPRFPDPIQIACGAAHTVLVAHEGYKLWSWGRGRSGVLGDGQTTDSYAPTLVLWPPPKEDFDQEELKEGRPLNKDTDGVTESEMDKKLSLAMEEIKYLQLKLSTLERYASIIHGSIFGKPFEEQDIPVSLQNAGFFDISKEWENMLESADQSRLVRMETFYRNMLAGVKDKLMKRRIREIVKECLQSSTSSTGK